MRPIIETAGLESYEKLDFGLKKKYLDVRAHVRVYFEDKSLSFYLFSPFYFPFPD